MTGPSYYRLGLYQSVEFILLAGTKINEYLVLLIQLGSSISLSWAVNVESLLSVRECLETYF